MNPKVAAKMPGYAAHLPTDFAEAMIQAQADESYGLPYAEYINELPGTTSIPLRRDQGAKKTNSNDPLHGHSSPTDEAEDKITLSKKSSARLINSKQLGLADADDPLIAPEKSNKSKSQLMMEDVDDQVLFSVGRTIGSDAGHDPIRFSTLFGIQFAFSTNEVSPATLDFPSV